MSQFVPFHKLQTVTANSNTHIALPVLEHCITLLGNEEPRLLYTVFSSLQWFSVFNVSSKHYCNENILFFNKVLPDTLKINCYGTQEKGLLW